MVILLLSLFWSLNSAQVNMYKTEHGKVQFHSEAQLEIINAASDKMKGVLNTTSRNFAFVIPISSFQGFNIALQREHFNENYMESDKYPNATFSGKIIEDVDFLTRGNMVVRAKGILAIHGVEQERIIKVSLSIRDGSVQVSSRFGVLLKDHDIKIPKIVHEKIASEIMVEVNAELKK